MRKFVTCVFIVLFVFNAKHLSAQCNVNASVCAIGQTQTFNFVNPGNQVSTCLDFYGPSVGYIMLTITTPGSLNLLIDGVSASGGNPTGYIDVAVFNIPPGVAPCTAIQSNSNQLGCNYANSSAGSCAQFGNTFGCPSYINPAPVVVAGQTIMIVAENWSGTSAGFTLQMSTQLGTAGVGVPNATINAAGPFCLTSPATQLTATNQGGTWSGPGVSASGMFNPATAGPGTHTINYTIGAPPCNSSSSTTVTVNAAGTLNVTPSTSICAGGSTTLTASGATTYSWSPSAGLSATTGNTVVASPTSTTTYTVTGTSSGCNATGTTTVTIGPNPAVTASSNSPICEGEDLQLQGSTPVAGASYSWTGPNGFTSTQQNPTVPDVSQANAGTYNLQISVNGCSNSGSTSLVINPNIYPVLVPAGPFCETNAAVTLSANIQGGIWSGPGITNATSGTFDPSQAEAGINLITYALTGPCGGSSEMEIVVTKNPVVNFTASSVSGCSPFTVTFTDNSTPPSQSALWNFGDMNNSPVGTASNTFINVGCYDITLTSTSNGCTSSQTLPGLICVQPDPVAEFAVPDYTSSLFYPTFSFTNQSSNAANYMWYFGDGSTSSQINPTHTYAEIAGSHEVTLVAISPAGCTDTTRNTVYVEEEIVFYVPNAFTPDGDEYNNSFFPVFTSGFDPMSYSMVIYDRWGEALFESRNTQVGWDGTYGGERCPAGTYVWTIRFKDSRNDRKLDYRGHITVIK